MALENGAEIRVAFRYVYQGQQCENVQSYELAGIVAPTVDMLQFLEALWDDYKTVLRAAAPANPTLFHFVSLYGTEVGGGLEFAEYPVPVGESLGLRGAVGDTTWVTGILAWGFRQSVATRLTRPGQKRFPWLVESDILGNGFVAGFDPLWEDIAERFCTLSTLGAPAAGIDAHPIVVHEPGVRDPVRHTQDITGFVPNANITSQVSRKLGHGT